MGHELEELRQKVIVSCQARAGHPFDAPHFIAEFAKAAALGGASALRIDGEANIRAVRAVTDLPVIGIAKRRYPNNEVYITPTLREVDEVILGGADIVAMDATIRQRPDGADLRDLVAACHRQSKPVLADIATLDDALFAVRCGADLVATTLAGYTTESRGRSLPDMELLENLVHHVPLPVILEGGVVNPIQVRHAFEAGAFAVVIGKAITMPHFITERFVSVVQDEL